MRVSIKRITLIYLFVGILWILLGDYLLFASARSDERILNLSLVKGLIYVSLTGIGLYYLLRVNENQLREVSREYQRLFYRNPNPMWIYEVGSLQILAVNKAATMQYGYTHNEFLKLNIMDLRPQEEKDKLLKLVVDPAPDFRDSGVWIHQYKSGEKCFYQVFANAAKFQGKDARLVVAVNVDEQVKNRQRILSQNKKLKEIAHLQSHDLRGPVSSILGLISIFDKSNQDLELNLEILRKLEESALKLDSIVQQVVDKTQVVDEMD